MNVTWRAGHCGPGGIAGAATFDTWENAARWLRAMMDITMPVVGYQAAVRALRDATMDAPFTIACGKHVFSLVEDGAVVSNAQAELFAAPPVRSQRETQHEHDGELPDWEDILGLAPDATGELASEDFVRELRHGWR